MKRQTKRTKGTRVLSVVLCVIALFTGSGCHRRPEEPPARLPQSGISTSQTSAETAGSAASSSTASSASATVSTSAPPAATAPRPVPAATTAPRPQSVQTYLSHPGFYPDIEHNVFLDSLAGSGYNLNKHRKDGLMWKYILWTDKRWRGWLSGIPYGGGSTGYETANGKPDLAKFKRGGLVCASYVTYVYFNYLPNVVGIDTSSLPRPVKSTSANDWYTAAKQWINLGYSKTIPFTASKGGGYIRFKSSESIPIGSIIVFCDDRNRSNAASHVAIYAGYKNSYNWLFQVGNSNGPEFCAIERMLFGPDPQWPIAVITPPSNVRTTASLEVLLKDEAGAPLSGAAFTLKNHEGKTLSLGKTDKNGRLVKEGFLYGAYSLIESVPSGYTADKATQAVTLTSDRNSWNTVTYVNKKIPPKTTPPTTSKTTASTTTTKSPLLETSTSSTPSAGAAEKSTGASETGGDAPSTVSLPE